MIQMPVAATMPTITAQDSWMNATLYEIGRMSGCFDEFPTEKHSPGSIATLAT